MKRIIAFAFLLLTTTLLYCQNDSFLLTGKLFDRFSYKPIENLKIINLSRKLFSYSNNTGLFQILCFKKDTLIFNGIGYFTKSFVVNDSIKAKSGSLIILFDPEIYELKETTINGLGTYNDFKKNFLAIKPVEQKPIILGLKPVKPGPPQIYNEKYVKSIGFAVQSPISFFYYNLNEKEKSKRKIFNLKFEAPITYEIEKKYNREKVGIWTGLTEFELNEFIVFCNFDRNFLINATEYQIIIETQEKLKEFKLKKEADKLENK